MKTLTFSVYLFAVCCAGLTHLAYADDAFTNTTTTTAPPPAAGENMYSNTTATTAPPPAAGENMYSNTTTTTAPPPAAGENMYSNTTTTTTPPPAAGEDMFTNTTRTVSPPLNSGGDLNFNTTTITAPSPLTAFNDDNTTTASTTTAMSAPDVDESNEPRDITRLYRDMELDLDVFGTLAVGRHTIDHISEQRIYHNSQLGLGAGGTLFFTRYVGIGGEAYSANTTGSFVDSASGSIFVRCPIDKIHLAPYAFGGGGYDFEGIKQGFGQAGVGLDARIIKNLGVFVDARYVFASESQDYGVGRAGIRISF